jgi:hypothetical protein
MKTYKEISNFFVFYIIVWVAIWVPFRYYAPLALRIRHTYQLPSTNCTNTLVSDLNDFSSVREGLMVLYVLVPFSACLMLWGKNSNTWNVHIFVLFFAFFWGLMTFSYDINDIAYSNIAPNDANFRPQNLARDNRWCLYWGGQVGTELLCANVGPCVGPGVSAIDPNSFTANGPFSTRFAFNLVILVKIMVDFWASWQWKKIVLSPPKKTEETTKLIKVRYQPRKKQ